jgi:hypothetical protein
MGEDEGWRWRARDAIWQSKWPRRAGIGWQVAVPVAQVADGIESTQSTPGRMTCGAHQVLNLNDFLSAQLQNSKKVLFLASKIYETF